MSVTLYEHFMTNEPTEMVQNDVEQCLIALMHMKVQKMFPSPIQLTFKRRKGFPCTMQGTLGFLL